MADIQKSKFNVFWLIILVLLLILGVMVMFGDVLTGNEPVSQTPQPASTEWTTRQEGGVEVNLPDTVSEAGETAEEASPGAETAEED